MTEAAFTTRSHAPEPASGHSFSAQPLEHLLRYRARPPFALERLSVMRGEDGRIACVRYVLPRHKAANWVGPGAGGSPYARVLTASSNSRHLTSWTGWP